jgi:hypothetical protein
MSAPGLRLSLSDLPAAGELVLAAYVTQLEAQGVNVPGRRYVSPGSGAQGIPWDGTQFNVAFQSIHQGQPGSAFAGTQFPGAAVLFGQWAVLILREIPILSANAMAKVSVPSAAAIDKAGQANLADISAMAKAALAIHGAYLFNPAGVGQSIDAIEPVGPDSGLVGVRLLFSTSLT